MRVAHVNQDPGISPGRTKGAAVHVEAMRQAFRELGCDVLAVDDDDDLSVRRALEQGHAERHLDVVYERYALGACGAARFSRNTGTPLVLEVNAPLTWEDRVRRGRARPPEVVNAAEVEVFGAASRILAVSRSVATYVADRGVPTDQITVRPNAMDGAIFHPRENSGVRRALGIGEDAFVVGFHGRLREWHGFPHLAQAVAELVSRGVPAHLTVVGTGAFESHIHAAGLSAAATIVDWVPHERVGEYVACFDVLPLTYPADQPCYFSPLKLLEAMACGVVPLVPDLGDLPLTVAHGQRGVVYPAGDMAALVGEMERIARDAAVRTRLGDGASSFARDRTWTAIAGEVLELARAVRAR